jgi:RNase adaptor protein for sRNA GlmZ degradation
MMNATQFSVEIVSFGYGHGPAPEADATFDVRRHFKDPHTDPALRCMTAEDAKVMQAVMATPGVPRLVHAIADAVLAYRCAPGQGLTTVAIGCVGGRHRSAGIAIEAARLLRRAGVVVELAHRDIDRPVIDRPGRRTP